MSLTPRRKRFAEMVASGRPYAQAYAECYGGTAECVRHRASRLAANAGVRQYVDELRRAPVAETLLSLREKRMALALIVRCELGSELDWKQMVELPNLPASKDGVADKGSRKGKYSRRGGVTVADKLRAIELDTKLAGPERDDSCAVAQETVPLAESVRRDERIRAVMQAMMSVTIRPEKRREVIPDEYHKLT